jgi:DNA (cytosine-5)-methyltransferase 1
MEDYMKLLSLFSGIGAFEKALDRMGINYELVNFCEFDKYATKSYCAIHGVDESKNLGDITKVDETKLPKDIDLVTYGFPCQDISNAGRQQGLFNDDGTQTRSGLFFEALRIIEETKPKIAIAENVKNLVGKKFKNQFEIVLNSLESVGYNNYWQVLNAKDFGIPQNRERVFIISIRKDLDNRTFKFPNTTPLTLRLKDMLEDEVDDKYYLESSKVNQFILNNPKIDTSKAVLGTCHERNDLSFATRDRVYNSEKESPTLTATMYKDPPKVCQIGNCLPTKTRENPNQGRVYDTGGLSPTLGCMQGGNRQPFVTVREATKKGYTEAVEGDCINLQFPNSKTRRGRVGKQVAQTLQCNDAMGVVVKGG